MGQNYENTYELAVKLSQELGIDQFDSGTKVFKGLQHILGKFLAKNVPSTEIPNYLNLFLQFTRLLNILIHKEKMILDPTINLLLSKMEHLLMEIIEEFQKKTTVGDETFLHIAGLCTQVLTELDINAHKVLPLSSLRPIPMESNSSIQPSDYNTMTSPPKVKKFASQYALFAPKPNEKREVFLNKNNITSFLRVLEERGVLSNNTFEDFNFDGTHFRGKQGIVHKVTEKSNPTVFKALKQWPVHLGEKIYFLREIELMTKLDHPNIMKIEKVFIQNDQTHVIHINQVMPWADDTLLSWLTKTEDGENKGLSKCKRRFEEVRNVLIDALKGITHLHEKEIIHLDIKFENLLVHDGKCLVTDLGICKKLEHITTDFAGTYLYLPPEQKQFMEMHAKDPDTDKKLYFTTKIDIYSFGVILVKLFLDENLPSAEFKEIPLDPETVPQKILERIEQLFPTDSASYLIPPQFHEEMFEILKGCLDPKAETRFDEKDLWEFPFFGGSSKKFPKENENDFNSMQNFLKPLLTKPADNSTVLSQFWEFLINSSISTHSEDPNHGFFKPPQSFVYTTPQASGQPQNQSPQEFLQNQNPTAESSSQTSSLTIFHVGKKLSKKQLEEIVEFYKIKDVTKVSCCPDKNNPDKFNFAKIIFQTADGAQKALKILLNAKSQIIGMEKAAFKIQ